jgi:phage-related protein
MARRESGEREVRRERKPLGWLHGEIKTPPFTEEGRKEAGGLLRLLQEGENLGMPQAEPLPIIGPRCGALRVRDAKHNWRIVYRVDPDAVLVLEVYAKKTRKVPQKVIDRCKKRLRDYEDTVKKAAEEAARRAAKGRAHE